MRELVIYAIPPVLGALIGYLTNVIAIKLLFHPRKPINILGFRIQGLIPAKSEEFAVRFVELIEDYVKKEDFRELIDEAIGKTLRESKLMGFLMNPIVEGVLERYGFKEKISEHIDGLVQRSQLLLSSAIVENMDFKKFLEKKIAEFSEDEAEMIFKRFAKKEMRFIEISGAVLGFIIGLVQTVLLIVAY